MGTVGLCLNFGSPWSVPGTFSFPWNPYLISEKKKESKVRLELGDENGVEFFYSLFIRVIFSVYKDCLFKVYGRHP